MTRLAPIFLLLLLACEPTAVEDQEMVELTLRLEVRDGRDIGSTLGKIYVFTDSQPVYRAAAFPELGEACSLTTTPVTTCTFMVPRRGPVTLFAHEPEPAVVVRFTPASSQDTVRDGRYVEFTGWNECPERTERGVCVVRPSSDLTIRAQFQRLQQITFYQTGVARMDYLMFSTGPTLRVPALNDNILDQVGCRRGDAWPISFTCDSLRLVGDQPHHRITGYVGRQTIIGIFSKPGATTEIVDWDGPCIPSSLYGRGVCSLISPDSSGAPIFITINYTWWECPSGPSERDTGGCAYRGLDPESGQGQIGTRTGFDHPPTPATGRSP
jgi:hypothetical protein